MNSLFALRGRVQNGKKRGKKMGFPTANFSVDLSTPQGTYISETKIKEKTYPSITFVGTVDTFDEEDFKAETYILGFDSNIYGEIVTIGILKKLRDNKKFETEEELIRQMKKDEINTREYFDRHKA